MRSKLKVALVVALIAINVFLLILLKDKVSDSRIEPSEVADAAGVGPSTQATALQEEPDPGAGGPAGLAVAADDTIYRFAGGSCSGAEVPVLKSSTDGGSTFGELVIPKNVRAIFAVATPDTGEIVMIAAGSSCEPKRFTSTDGGAQWDKSSDLDAWFVSPVDDVVVSPDGEVDAGCTAPLSVWAEEQLVRVVCESGVMIGSSNGGASWDRLGRLEDARAAAFSSSSTAVALAPDGECPVGVFATDSAAGTWESRACIDAESAEAIASNGATMAAVVGNELYVSEDDGQSWKKP